LRKTEALTLIPSVKLARPGGKLSEGGRRLESHGNRGQNASDCVAFNQYSGVEAVVLLVRQENETSELCAVRRVCLLEKEDEGGNPPGRVA